MPFHKKSRCTKCGPGNGKVLSRIGIPGELLTDYGGVVTGKLMKELYKTLGIIHLKTLPYHPETDGCIERWHSSLKSMLKKRDNRQRGWDKLLKYLLFAYRAAPHKKTGYSFFEVIFGRQLRGPLDVVRDAWLSGDM